LTIFFTSDDQM